jgi:hypothetical protein
MTKQDYEKDVTKIQRSLSLYKKKQGIYKCPADEVHHMYINGEEASLNYYKGCDGEGEFLLLIGDNFGDADAGRDVYSFKDKEIATLIEKYKKK